MATEPIERRLRFASMRSTTNISSCTQATCSRTSRSMLEKTGWVDDLWMTEDGQGARIGAVHKLTADYDLGALDPATLR
jgi:hypothetical protein